MGNKRIIWIGAIIVLVVIGGVVWALSGSSSKSGNNGGTAASATPTPVETTYAGTDTLVSQGASSEQIDDLKFALYKFTQTKNGTPQNVIITGAKHVHSQTAAGAALDSINFGLQIDDSLYNAQLIESGLTSAQLILTEANGGSQVYDSGVVDVDNQ